MHFDPHIEQIEWELLKLTESVRKKTQYVRDLDAEPLDAVSLALLPTNCRSTVELQQLVLATVLLSLARCQRMIEL